MRAGGTFARLRNKFSSGCFGRTNRLLRREQTRYDTGSMNHLTSGTSRLPRFSVDHGKTGSLNYTPYIQQTFQSLFRKACDLFVYTSVVSTILCESKCYFSSPPSCLYPEKERYVAVVSFIPNHLTLLRLKQL